MYRNIFVFQFFLILVFSVSHFPQTDYALQFNGTDGYVSIPHNTVFNVSKVTIEMWIYWEESAGTDVDFLIGKATEQLEIHTGGGSGNFGLRFIPTTGVYLDTETNVITQNQWYHLAFAYDPSQGLTKCYINGVEKTLYNHGVNPVTTPIVQTGQSLHLGVRWGLFYYFKGKIDEVRIWNYIRTQQQIQDNRLTTLSGNESGLIAYYQMSNGSGTTLNDNSTTGNNGTFYGGVTWVTSDSPLPVELVSFSGSSSDKDIQLRWVTVSEVNNYGFEVERKQLQPVNAPGSGEWVTVGFVQGHGNSYAEKRYSFSDQVTGRGIYTYRLKQIDADGSFTYSGSIQIETGALPGTYQVGQNFPNPFNPSTSLRFSLPVPSEVIIGLYTAGGELIADLVSSDFEAGTHLLNFNLASYQLSSGVYFLKFNAVSEQGTHSGIIKISLLK